jgi:hypothetical protein
MSITTLNLGRIKFVWKGNWTTGTAYIINDVVRYGGNSYTCLTAHTADTWIGDSANWDLMVQGSTVNTTKGDITYRDTSSDARLPIGTAGQVLTVSSTGVPVWGNPNAEGSVYYVSDQGSDTNNGTSLNAAFLTLRKACDTITGPATIYVKAGTYPEKLPITVPANVTIIGDGMRNTEITPLLGSATATYVPTGSGGTTLKVSSTSGIAVGMTISGTGFASAQKVVTVVDGTTLTTSVAPNTTPSGTLTFRHLSTDASPVVNNLSTMFYLSDSTMVQGLLMTGMTGFTSGSPADSILAATIGGVYFRLNPNTTISSKSPYVKDCTAKSAGGVGAIVDGSVQSGGYKSMVFWAYNIVMDGGVGLWASNGGRIEAVSVFTYYAYIGYATTTGGQIRSLSGNNSYGTYGAVSKGYDSTETPITANVYGGMLTFNQVTSTGTFQQGETITQATSGATGVVTSVQSGYLYYKSTSGTFNTTNLVTGGTSSATMTPSAVGGQSNYILVLSSLSTTPSTLVGASIQFATGDTSAYIIASYSSVTVNAVSLYIVVLAQQKSTPSTDGTVANVRYNFSLIRLQGHDFLYIGTGGISATNYPTITASNAIPANQIVYTFPGRVYYVSTDEKGNFNVGQYFSVNQATGAATLNASAFNLSGLTSLRLGSIGAQLGAQVDEFSTDGTLGQNSGTKVPTQSAVRTYLGASYQSFVPATDLTYDLGSASKRWRSLYVGAGSVTIGTITLSDSSGTLAVTSSGANVPVNINSINNGTSNVTVANNGSVTITGGGNLGLTISSSGDATFAGSVTVNGGATNLSTTNLNISDALIYMAQNNPANSNDIGLVGHFTASSTYQHTGMVRQASTNTWMFFSGATTEPTTTITTTDGTFVLDPVKMGGLTATTGAFSSTVTLGAASALRFTASGGSNYVGFTAPATIASNVTWTLPSADGTNGYALTTNGSGTLSWTAVGASLADDTSTATLYPVLSGSATGTLSSAKTTASKLTFNASTGNLTATQLTGTLQTAAQTNITSVGTLTGLTVAGNLTNYASSAGATVVVFGNARTNDYTWMDYNSYPGASDGYTIGGRRAYSSLTGSKVQVGTEQFMKEGSGTDNKTAWNLSLHNGTSIGVVLACTSAGNLTVTGTITSNSDARLKTNVETITTALDKVVALRGVMFDRISTGVREMGVIAQEVEQIVPELVFTDENGIKSVAYANTVALLIEAIKEQQQQINELKGKL